MNRQFLEKLDNDYPDLVFKRGKKFAFRFPRTITIGPEEPFDEMLILHEVSHALLGHKDFKEDLERVKMEGAAWEKAKELARQYDIEINEELIQDELDTYRDWLHQKSRCPVCGLTRYQTPDSQYHCPSCETFRNNKK